MLNKQIYLDSFEDKHIHTLRKMKFELCLETDHAEESLSFCISKLN
jgi:hypothetical protein